MKFRSLLLLVVFVSPTCVPAEATVGESIGRTARGVTDSVENAYLSTEDFFISTADDFDRNSRKAGRSIENFFDDITDPVERFMRDVENGYMQRPR